MKVCLNQFLGTNHSWSIVGQNIARGLLQLGHDVHLKSTNGYEHFPKDLEVYVRENLDKDYDMQISYTALKNFPYHLSHGKKNRFGIWNYETTILPTGFAKFHKFADKVCPSSAFAGKVFTDNAIPKDKVVVIPHGINVDEYKNPDIYNLNTDKKVKILANIAQPHIRKNIAGMLEAYGRAFTKDDDVCLVCKVSVKTIPKKEKPKFVKNRRAANILNKKAKQSKKNPQEKIQAFNVDFWKLFNNFKNKYPKHAEVEIITDFLPSMTSLYNAVDSVFTTTHAECFWLPGLEGMATDNIIVAPNWGGQLEYMNDDNSILIGGKEIRAPKEMQYWTSSPYAAMFEPDLDEAAEKLQMVYKNKDQLIEKFRPGMKEQLDKLTWVNVAKSFTDLCVE
jgi:glycosyltransferase involved in cell wall biosynthesis